MANDTHRMSPTPAHVERKLVAILSADVAGYSELGREAEARAEAAEVLRRNPNFSVETAWRKENQPFKDPLPILERLYAAARRAGLK